MISTAHFSIEYRMRGYSELPWRNPLETNNIVSGMRLVACEYQGFFVLLQPFPTRLARMKNHNEFIYVSFYTT